MAEVQAGEAPLNGPAARPCPFTRRYPIGAELTADGVSFRVWSPQQADVWVVLEDGPELEMRPDGEGYFAVHIPYLTAGAQYRFKLENTDLLLADPHRASNHMDPLERPRLLILLPIVGRTVTGAASIRTTWCYTRCTLAPSRKKELGPLPLRSFRC